MKGGGLFLVLLIDPTQGFRAAFTQSQQLHNVSAWKAQHLYSGEPGARAEDEQQLSAHQVLLSSKPALCCHCDEQRAQSHCLYLSIKLRQSLHLLCQELFWSSFSSWSVPEYFKSYTKKAKAEFPKNSKLRSQPSTCLIAKQQRCRAARGSARHTRQERAGRQCSESPEHSLTTLGNALSSFFIRSHKCLQCLLEWQV